MSPVSRKNHRPFGHTFSLDTAKASANGYMSKPVPEWVAFVKTSTIVKTSTSTCMKQAREHTETRSNDDKLSLMMPSRERQILDAGYC